jgi:TolC family type I secretion outer membrane protein
MNKRVLYYLIYLLILPGIGVCQQDTLTLNKSIEIALKNNPQIKLAEGNYDYADANVKLARSLLFPQVSFQAGYVKNGGSFFFGPTSRTAYYENYSLTFQLQQLIFDFGKTYSRISANVDLRDASHQDYLSAKQDLILSTEIGYFNYLQAKRVRDASIEVVKQTQEHLTQAQAFYRAGTVAQFDVLKAQTDLANAKVNLISAENNVRISRLQLENVLSQKLGGSEVMIDNLETQQDSIEIHAAMDIAMNNRPELISSKLKVEAGKSYLTSAWAANLPSINATGGYNKRSYGFVDEYFLPSWNIGATISIPIFQGFALDAGIDQARANLKISESSNDELIQNVTLEVQQQYSSLQQTRESIEATRALVAQSEETLKLAEGRYKQGVGSAVEITDAQVGLYNAKTSYIQSLYQYQVAYAGLKHAMGTLK